MHAHGTSSNECLFHSTLKGVASESEAATLLAALSILVQDIT